MAAAGSRQIAQEVGVVMIPRPVAETLRLLVPFGSGGTPAGFEPAISTLERVASWAASDGV